MTLQGLAITAALAGLFTVTAIPPAAQAQDPRRMLGPLSGPFRMMLRGLPRPRVGVPHRRQRNVRVPAEQRNAPAATERPAARQKLARGAPAALWPAAAPTAYEDMVGYALWPSDYGDRFWTHGPRNIIMAMVTPSATFARGRERRRQPNNRLVSAANADETTGTGSASCVDRARAHALRPVDRIAEAIELAPEQHTKLDALRAAVVAAVEREKTSCRDDSPMTPPERLRAMIDALWAMRYAEFGIRTSLETFYGSLTDAQKKQLSDQQDRHETPASLESPAGLCNAAAPARTGWLQQVERAVRPTAGQRESLKMLQGASMEMAQFLMTTCPQETPTTAITRFDAAGDRVMTLIHAAMNIEPLFNNFYFQLSDGQKARFNTLVR
jgi:hypothetical protein